MPSTYYIHKYLDISIYLFNPAWVIQSKVNQDFQITYVCWKDISDIFVKKSFLKKGYLKAPKLHWKNENFWAKLNPKLTSIIILTIIISISFFKNSTKNSSQFYVKICVLQQTLCANRTQGLA